MRYQSNIFFRKRFKSLLVFLFLIALSITISCNKDEEEENEPEVYLPEIILVKPDTTEFIISPGEEFLLSVTATSNPTSNASLTLFRVLRNFNNFGYVTVFDSVINTNHFMLEDWVCKAHLANGFEEWKIVIRDVNGGSDSVMFITEIVDLNPTLSFLSGEYEPGKERVDGDTTFPVGEQFVFGITAQSATTENLDRILIERNFENISNITVLDTFINISSFTIDIITFAYPTPGLEEFICTAWDKKDRHSTISFAITTLPAASNITTYEDKILGAQNSNTGSSFASADGTVYMLADAKENAAEIDFMYFFEATNLATLAAPDDPDAALVFNNAQNGLQTWDVLNDTRFKETTLSSADFNAITSSTQLVIAATLPTAPDQTKINNLIVGKVLAFETWDENYGLILIDNITGTADGSIDITVKVQ
jgi:hypothetical protein